MLDGQAGSPDGRYIGFALIAVRLQALSHVSAPIHFAALIVCLNHPLLMHSYQSHYSSFTIYQGKSDCRTTCPSALVAPCCIAGHEPGGTYLRSRKLGSGMYRSARVHCPGYPEHACSHNWFLGVASDYRATVCMLGGGLATLPLSNLSIPTNPTISQVLCSSEAWESCTASASALRLVTATSLGLFQLKGIQERIEVFHCT